MLLTATRVGENIGIRTYQKQYRCTRSRTHYPFTWQRVIEQLELARIAIIRAFRDAAHAGERWFTGETTLLLAMEEGQTNFEGLGKVKVHPHAAVEWLLSKPKREHLVPESLSRSLQSGGEPTNGNAPTAPRPVTKKKLSASSLITFPASRRRGGALLSLVLKLLRRKLTCVAVGSISALPSVDHRAPRSGAGVRLRRLRKSPKNNRRDFADLGHRPHLRDGLPTSGTKRGASKCQMAVLKLMTSSRLSSNRKSRGRCSHAATRGATSCWQPASSKATKRGVLVK